MRLTKDVNERLRAWLRARGWKDEVSSKSNRRRWWLPPGARPGREWTDRDALRWAWEHREAA